MPGYIPEVPNRDLSPRYIKNEKNQRKVEVEGCLKGGCCFTELCEIMIIIIIIMITMIMASIST